MTPEDYLSPDWTNNEKVHNWRNYASEELKRTWHTFTSEQRRVVAEALKEVADMEEWL
ncbi:recombinase RecA [Klebsiella variicola]|uniref:recombinase RecA n=1 Tax=Klebsiella variicola TaxID=244366 RepID=UPI0010F55317|nr:recombinase RecA [Klebsiella variicola]